MKLAVITGITGFLGSRIARALLDNGVQVIGLKRASSDLRQLAYLGIQDKVELYDMAVDHLDLPSILKGRGVDVVFHTAAHTSFINTEAEAIDLLNVNVRFPCQLLAQARSSGLVRAFVNAGTSWQSADGHGYSPLNFYAATKDAFENCLSLTASADFPCASLRLFDTYGPGDHRNKIIDLLVCATLQGKSLAMSPGEQKLFFVHIKDVVAAFIAAGDLAVAGRAPGHHVYSVAGHEAPRRLRDVADIIGRLASKSVPALWGQRVYHPNQIMEPRVAYPAVPGWEPQIGLETGLLEVIRYYERALPRVA